MKELDLYPNILESFNNTRSIYKVAKELRSGYGVADLVFYKLKGKDAPLKTKHLSIYKYNILKILLNLNRNQATKVALTSLDHLLPNNKADKIRLITYLEEAEYIEILSNNLIKKRKSYKVGIKEAIAIEAKLFDWKRGLYQAYRYKAFSNTSYLALHTSKIKNAIENIELFEKRNVGLIEVKKDDIEFIFTPKYEPIQENIYSALAYENLLDLENL